MTETDKDGREEQAPQTPPTPEVTPDVEEATLMKPEAAPPMGTPARLLEDAVAQLRKLSELREQEIKRNELLIAEMREHVRRSAGLGRTFRWLGLAAVALLIVLGLGVNHLRKDQNRTETEVRNAADKIERLNQDLVVTAERSAARLDDVTVSLTEASGKLGAVESGIAAKVDDSLLAVRQERDAVRHEVRQTLDGQHQELLARELVLRDEAERLTHEAERVHEERTRILQEAIAKLNAIAGEPSPGQRASKEPPAAADEDAEESGAEAEGADESPPEPPQPEGQADSELL